MNRTFVFDPETFQPSQFTWDRANELIARWEIVPPRTDHDQATQIALGIYKAGQLAIIRTLMHIVQYLPIIHDRECVHDCEASDLYCKATVEFGVPQAIYEILEFIDKEVEGHRNHKDVYPENIDARHQAHIAGAAAFLRTHGYHVLKSEAPTN